MNLTPTIETSARRLFPHQSPEQAFAELLLERAQKKLIQYQAAIRLFQTKYGQDFEVFRKHVISTEPSLEVEQDYFDWELAMTGVADMRAEIVRLKNSGR
ncbi:MAG: hypothetical protein DRI56_09580 [Chloroflexota bacterium]|nr:MAG: hypothetical protein DRI56_09580 [Chloroflexota bacterium]